LARGFFLACFIPPKEWRRDGIKTLEGKKLKSYSIFIGATQN